MVGFSEGRLDGKSLSHYSAFSLLFNIPCQKDGDLVKLDLHHERLVVQQRGF
jgi:hypothetical protein